MVPVNISIWRRVLHYYYSCLALPALLLLLLLLLPIQTQQQQHPTYAMMIPAVHASDTDDLVHQALVSIREADSVGADTSHLVARLNDALNLIRQAERTDGSGSEESCPSRDECIVTATGMLNSITDEAIKLHEQKVKENTNRFYINMLVYAPIGAIASSAISAILYVSMKSYMQARMMEMDVREVKEE
ncbi:MAG: hypothetical protein QW248_05275 [Candidatus Nitrosocaldus sp.]